MFFKNKPVRLSRPPVEEPPEPITLRKLSHPSEDMFSELNPISNLSEIVHFKPTELLSQKSSTKNDIPETIRIPSNKPHFMGLVGSKLLRQNEINATFLCVKGIKYTNSFVLASYHLRTNHKNNNTLKKKIFIYLKRLKLCPTFQLVEGDLLPLSQTDVAFVRRASLQLVKNIRRGQWGKHLQDFNKYRALESLSSCSVKGMRLPRTAKKLNFRQFFACDKVGKYAVRQIRKLPHLSALSLNNESLLDVLKFQNEVSEVLKEQKNLQDITLHCYYNQEFDHRRILPPILPGIALWARLTELSIFNSSEDSTIHLLLDNMPTFRNLKNFTYSEVRSNPAQFPLFQCLKELASLAKLSLSITLPDAINEEEIGAKLFQSLCFPMNLEHLSLTITGTKPWKFLQHATNSQGFFTAISQLGKLISFAISVATYTFVDYIKQEEQEILISFLFFNNIVTSLSRQVTDLSLSLFQPVLMSNSPLTNDKLFYIISRDLKNLKNLTLNLLGINLTPKKLDPPVLSRLKTLTLYNLSLPFSSLNLLEAVHIEELNCWIAGEVDLESAVLFLREVNFLTSLKILQLQFSKLNYAKFTQSLMLELAKIFLNLKGLEDFNLGLTPVVIEKLWGEWLVQLCHCKKGLRFCNMKFNNYQIVKEYFAVTLKDS